MRGLQFLICQMHEQAVRLPTHSTFKKGPIRLPTVTHDERLSSRLTCADWHERLLVVQRLGQIIQEAERQPIDVFDLVFL